jgi:hypothetical protein
MDAKEARRRSLDITGNNEKTQYAEIHNWIVKEVNLGNFSVSYYKSLLSSVKKKLEDEGYGVDVYFDQRDGTTNTISW